MYWGLVGNVGTQGPEGVYAASGVLGAPRSVGELLGVSGGVGVYWGLAGSIGTQGPEGV